MLEVKNLVKSYSTKGGVTVKALDDVSVKFPETGMVFLLGRSGSGKSTLLNVSGGLDKPDSGEIIVKGRSSKDFTTADFDSYRNTFVGFIFQEYNILNEFTVEQNIALALQLQNKPSDKKAVNDLLEKVDLKGYGKRKPNTLSGGQKQRVAIARALIKEPEIIMADEPTGALDSTTGKQVLDTLKKLSETKLVVVVSHDREFAEFYGDRIIELKDGKILSDVSKTEASPKDASKNVQLISDDTIRIKNTEEITEDDVKNILSVLKKNKGEAIFTASKRELPDVKRACKINENGSKEIFEDTKEVKIKDHDGSKTKFIKSKLPMSHAFKMGASGLKTKPIRLIFTILLSVVAFLMFGVVSTFTFYDPNYSISEALKESNYPSITLSKYYKVMYQNYKVDLETGEQTLDYESENTYSTLFGESELAQKNASGNGKYAGIFSLKVSRWEEETAIILNVVSGSNFVTPDVSAEDKLYYPINGAVGFTDAGADYMTANGFTLIGEGKYPTNPTEIAIPEYIANLFVKTEGSGIENVNALVGKKVRLNGCSAIGSDEFTIVGIYDVGDIPAKYDEIKDANNSAISEKEKTTLKDSLSDYLKYSFNNVIYVSNDFYDEYKDNIRDDSSININTDYAMGIQLSGNVISTEMDVSDYGLSIYTDKTVENYGSAFKFYNLNGNQIDFSITENQIFLNKQVLENAINNAVRNYVNEVMNSNLYKYDDGARAIVGADGSDTEFRQALDGEPTTEKMELLSNFLDEWYSKLAKRKYLYNALESMYSRSISLSDGKFTTSEISDLLNKLRDYLNADGVSPTDTDWTTVENIVFNEVDGFADYCKQSFYGEKLYEIYQRTSGEQDQQIKEELAVKRNPLDEGYCFPGDVSNMLINGEISDEDEDRVYAVIEKWYPIVLNKAFSIDTPSFEVEYDVPTKIYYKNYLGQTGELDVVGFFDAGADAWCEYLVADAFISAKSKPNENQTGFEWISVEKTDYVKPTDAKYNYLITLTDNSEESISNALSSDETVVVKIQNEVYAQLELFLDTISEMKTIFLIIGSVFGVFAGLMLLNFISVSISAKRKDIGILRAVGARGSDVFKIFFSEAFIIASLCFIIASIGAGVVCGVINGSLVTIVNMKLLNFKALNVALVFVLSFGISIIATFFPVYFASKKPPVESIRAL